MAAFSKNAVKNISEANVVKNVPIGSYYFRQTLLSSKTANLQHP